MDLTSAQARANTPGALVWHYTSLETLQKVLESGVLLATEVSFLNDIRETETADEAIEEWLASAATDAALAPFARSAKRLLDDFREGVPWGGDAEQELTYAARFVLCASIDNDSLYAWRTYGSPIGIGCAIGLDPSRPLGVLIRPGARPGNHRVVPWREVTYDRKDLAAEVDRRLREVAALWRADYESDYPEAAFRVLLTDLDQAIGHLRSIAKDPSFADEREIRMTISGAGGSTRILFTPSRMGPRPHVEVASAETWTQKIADSPVTRLPIRAVMLGPDAPASAHESLRWMLMANGYPIGGYPDEETHEQDFEETVIVRRSRHPYRST
jgi:hypothetical protein